ncbi:hypothetical protein [Herbidospora solisilvae]|nr:hypothetical protein [Herbidospora solisilvae]
MPTMDGEAGRFAELVVCAELIQRAEREHDRSTLETVRAHADGLLQRT